MTAPAVRHNLPAPISSFIGRDDELREIACLLDAHRLVTLTGVGGTGKTRLALSAGAAEVERHAEGVWLAELAPLSSQDLLVDAIAHAVGAPASGEAAPLDALVAYLAHRRLLLVLDNCEHLLTVAVRVVAALLARSPELRVLATSREPLGITGERVLRVPPLALPDGAAPLESERLLAYDAIRLFVERARAAEPSFQFSTVSAAPVLEICRRLDGIPLALELAAVRVRGMGVAYLSERLDDRFRLLTAGDSTGEPRQRTLHALVEWSHDLLDPPERVVLRRLCAFRGGFAAEAAEAVCVGEYESEAGRAALTADAVMDGLARLVDKSLAQYDLAAGRYRLLETIALFGRQRLEAAGEANFIGRQHFVHYLHLVEDGAQLAGGLGEAAWFARLEHEHDNLRAALDWALRADRADEAARLALGVWAFWRAHGHAREALRRFQAILALAGERGLPDDLRPRVLNALGVLANEVHLFAESRAYQEEARRLWTAAGDQAGMAQALIDLGWQHFQTVQLAETRRYASEALPLAEASGDRRVLASALFLDALADVHADIGLAFAATPPAERDASTSRRAVPVLERTLALWRELGDLRGQASGLGMLGMAHFFAGAYAQARPVLAEAARAHVQMGSVSDLTGALVALMNLAAATATSPEAAADGARIFGLLNAQGERYTDAPSPWNDSPLARQMTDRLLTLLGTEGYATAFAEGKRLTPTELLAVVERIVAPETPAAPPIVMAPAHVPHDTLTPREREVLRLVAQGMTNAQVADALVVTPRTVNAHLTAIYGKLGVTSRGGAIRYAVAQRLD
jgi:predicted ATPase/DNA-binding CsgD family transcriptional regulator